MKSEQQIPVAEELCEQMPRRSLLKTRRYYSIAVIGLLISLSSIVQAQNLPLSPRTILTKMVDQYEHASSYQDVGVLRVFPNDSSPLDGADNRPLKGAVDNQTLVSFKTYFRRPRMFRFEWQSSLVRAPRNSVIWTHGKQVYSWAANKVIGEDRFVLKKESAFSLLIDKTMKPSGGSVFTVPSLLITDLAYYTFADLVNDLTDLTIVREDLLDGEMSYVIKGKASTVPWLLWVGKKSYLLRKPRSFYSIGSFHGGWRRVNLTA